MPVNKNFLKRVRIINSCLADSPITYWSKERLLERLADRMGFPVGERTLESDIYKMRNDLELNYNAPIAYSKKNGGYYYSDDDYSIDNLPLNEHDIESLEFAATILSQFQDVKILSEFSGTIHKVVGVINHIKHTNHESSFSFIDFEKGSYLKGSNHLGTLVEVIKNKKAIKVTYQKFDNSLRKEHIIHPYLLKEYRNRWYLLGFHTKKKDIITLALDRMVDIDILDDDYIENQYELSKFFENTIGINYLDKKPQRIVLSFTPFQGKYVKTQHIHKSQKTLIDNDDEFRIEIKVIPNYELTSMIMSYCDNVKVISPKPLRTEIQNIIQQCQALYGE